MMTHEWNNTSFDNLLAEHGIWYCNCQIWNCGRKFLLYLIAFVVLVILAWFIGFYLVDAITCVVSNTLSLVFGMLTSATKIMMLPIFISTTRIKPSSPISHPVMASPQPACSKTEQPPNDEQVATNPETDAEAVAAKVAKSIDILAVDIQMFKTELLFLQKNNHGVINRLDKLETETRSMFKVLNQRITELENKIEELSDDVGIVNDKLEGLREEISNIKATLNDLAANLRKMDASVCKKFRNTEVETESVISCKSGNCPPNTPRYIETVVVREKIVVTKCVDNEDIRYGRY